MTQTLIKTIADFSTTLTTKTAVGATTGTLTTGVDSDSVQLPTATYAFTIDRNNSQKEHFTATLTGAALTSIETVTRGTGLGTSGLLRTHRKGAEVVISDHAAIKRMMNVLDGTDDLDAATVLKYDAAITQAAGSNELASVAYVDGVAIAGAADATVTTKGIVEEATQAEIDADTAAGSTSARLFVNPSTLRTSEYGVQLPTSGEKSALVGNNTDIAVGTGNKLVTQTGLQDGAEVYAADAGANDTYVITLSPVPAALQVGQVFHFKANTVNTGACTLNVNSLGAIAIKKNHDQDPADGDIEAGQLVTLIYDGTNFQMQSQTGIAPAIDVQTYTSGDTWTKPGGAAKIFVQLWGGGGGSGGCITNADSGGGGGGGYTEMWLLPGDTGATETVTIGAAGAAGASGDNDGGAGGATTFGSLATGYGGALGQGGSAGGTDTGGNGGGSIKDGAQAANTASYDFRGGGAGAANNSGGDAIFGGGGGGGSGVGVGPGGDSIYGGAGGGGGYVAGASVAGVSTYGGNGGAGGGNGVGAAGTAPGGGAGGSGSNAAGSRAGAAGAVGQMIVTTYF